MKLAHTSFSMIIDWPENIVPVLIVESPKHFRQLIKELVEQCDGGHGGFVLSENWEPLVMQDTCSIITEPLFLQINDRQTMAALVKNLKAITVNERQYLGTQEIKYKIEEWLSILADESLEPLQWANEIDIMQVIKACNVQFEGEEYDAPEKLLRRISLSQDYLNKHFFFFVNLKRYLSKEELHAFYQTALYQKARILLLENNVTSIDNEYETHWIIDKDDCEIAPTDV